MYSKRETINTLSFILICVIMQVTIFLFIIMSYAVSTLRLDQLVILSRHGIRSPLSKNLARMTPQHWPNWNENPGYLTDKGFVLEGYMGKYFSHWWNKEGLFLERCPSDSDFYVYANSIQRTMTSAEAFINNAFPDCNITIHHSDSKESDPIFSPFIHNSSTTFREIALEQMKNILKNQHLVPSYSIMQDLLNYTYSDICEVDKECNLATDVINFDIVPNKKPKVTGPLKICNEAIDAFLMAYYDGFPMTDVAWGKINNDEQWNSILGLQASYHNVTYNTTLVANDIAKPLITYMKDIFLNKNTKAILLMGHDANINVILNAMSFKPYKLLDNYVSTPISGKIVFQKWFNRKVSQHFLKIDYVYQTNQQLRDGQELTSENPPKFVSLQLKHCEANDEGYCLWDDFISFLNNL